MCQLASIHALASPENSNHVRTRVRLKEAWFGLELGKIHLGTYLTRKNESCTTCLQGSIGDAMLSRYKVTCRYAVDHCKLAFSIPLVEYSKMTTENIELYLSSLQDASCIGPANGAFIKTSPQEFGELVFLALGQGPPAEAEAIKFDQDPQLQGIKTSPHDR